MNRDEARKILWVTVEQASDEELDELLCNMRWLVSKLYDAYEEWILPIKKESDTWPTST